MSTTHDNAEAYYGEILQHSSDLKTGACCSAESMPQHVQQALKKVHPEVVDKFYGCGSPIPLVLEGMTVLDLGCGTGRDCYILSQLVGEQGQVIGVDMTASQLAIANQYLDWHMTQFGYQHNNITFKQGYIERLGIDKDSVDLVISNCVINLSPEKEQVFSEIFRVLKPGGELYFSDIFADRRMSAPLKDDPVLQGECLAGALYTEDFRRLLQHTGCLDYRVCSTSPVPLLDAEVARKVGMMHFISQTVRVFNCDFEDICEDYGQVAWYKGTMVESLHQFVLDDHHTFYAGQPMLVCANTAKMLTETRYAPHFRVEGDLSTHYGAFDCNPDFSVGEAAPSGSCC